MAEVLGQLSGAVMFTEQEIAAFPRCRWYFGSGLPADSLGANDDIYLDRESGDIYQKEEGTWA